MSGRRKEKAPPSKKKKESRSSSRTDSDGFQTVTRKKKDGRPDRKSIELRPVPRSTSRDAERDRKRKSRRDQEVANLQLSKEARRDPVLRKQAKGISEQVAKLNEESRYRKAEQICKDLAPETRSRLVENVTKSQPSASSSRPDKSGNKGRPSSPPVFVDDC